MMKQRRSIACCCKGLKLTELPQTLTRSTKVLYLYNTSIPEVSAEFFDEFSYIEELEIDDSPSLEHFDASCLQKLKNLRKISITKCQNLREISGRLLVNNTKIQSVILRENGLQSMPTLRMTEMHQLSVDIDLSSNNIKFIGDSKIRDVRARSLKLSNNHLIEIAGYAFRGSSFVKLTLDNNPELTTLSLDAFKTVTEIHYLDLSSTSIDVLPINGLKNLRHLKVDNVPTLKKIPSVLSFINLETAHFTYPHHCCLFRYVDDVVIDENGQYQKNAKEIHKRICSEKGHRKKREVTKAAEVNFIQDMLNFFTEMEASSNVTIEDDDDEMPPFAEIGAAKCESVVEEIQKYYRNISCFPQPNNLNPCENIVGYPLLRKAIWFVWIAAILGNIVVWMILALAYEKRMKVHYLFMLNMSIADLITGTYLAVLAIADAKMTDEYFRYAVWWQTGWGCRVAGFLAVFASELGIISMFLIAFEMSYNTRQSFHGKRLSPRMACFLMILGWAFAVFMAILPWFGVSSYSESSICLPLRCSSVYDKAYLTFGLFFNLLAFIAMACSYGFIVKMLRENESRAEDRALILKMALLVMTDLVCWFPTLFFGVTASMGFPLISLSNAKFLLVFFFPINSFANPFLYVFFTKVIQKRVKNKTMPVIRMITTTPVKGLSSLSNFYNSMPPGQRKDEARLGVSQVKSTSMGSTPRSSNGDCLDFNISRTGSSPRVSFDLPSSPTRSEKRPSLLKRLVSTIPEVSDLSEHSSESHHEHVPTRRRTRGSLNRLFNRNHPENGLDSGRGSLASCTENVNEKSAQPVAETDGLLPAPSSSPEGGTSRPSPLSIPGFLILPTEKPFEWLKRRKSTPAIPLLVVSECSDKSFKEDE